MTPVIRRLVAVAAVAAVATAVAAPAAMAADHTQQLNIGAELVRQPAGKPWVVNLLLGADLGMTDGTVPSPVDHMKFSFTTGAKVHSEAFGTCSEATLQSGGPGACPASSRLGGGTATAEALETKFPAQVDVFNGPGKPSNRKILVFARAIQTVTVILSGTLKKTSGKYGWVLDLPVPRIPTVGDNDASITAFNVKVGGFGRVKGKRVPFIEAPTACKSPGWPFLGEFHYTDGGSGTSSAVIGCTLKAANT
jgi:hypothetical protein